MPFRASYMVVDQLLIIYVNNEIMIGYLQLHAYMMFMSLVLLSVIPFTVANVYADCISDIITENNHMKEIETNYKGIKINMTRKVENFCERINTVSNDYTTSNEVNQRGTINKVRNKQNYFSFRVTGIMSDVEVAELVNEGSVLISVYVSTCTFDTKYCYCKVRYNILRNVANCYCKITNKKRPTGPNCGNTLPKSFTWTWYKYFFLTPEYEKWNLARFRCLDTNHPTRCYGTSMVNYY